MDATSVMVAEHHRGVGNFIRRENSFLGSHRRQRLPRFLFGHACLVGDSLDGIRHHIRVHPPWAHRIDRDARLGEIECQTLILQGTKDGMMPPESGQLLMREIPHAKLLYVYDAGHNIEVDQPQRFVSLIRDFLSRGEAFIVNPGDALAGVRPDAG